MLLCQIKIFDVDIDYGIWKLNRENDNGAGEWPWIRACRLGEQIGASGEFPAGIEISVALHQ